MKITATTTDLKYKNNNNNNNNNDNIASSSGYGVYEREERICDSVMLSIIAMVVLTFILAFIEGHYCGLADNKEKLFSGSGVNCRMFGTLTCQDNYQLKCVGKGMVDCETPTVQPGGNAKDDSESQLTILNFLSTHPDLAHVYPDLHQYLANIVGIKIVKLHHGLEMKNEGNSAGAGTLDMLSMMARSNQRDSPATNPGTGFDLSKTFQGSNPSTNPGTGFDLSKTFQGSNPSTNPGTGFDLSKTFQGSNPSTKPGTGFDLSKTFQGSDPATKPGTGFDLSKTFQGSNPDRNSGTGFDLSKTFQGSNPTTNPGTGFDLSKTFQGSNPSTNPGTGFDLSKTFQGSNPSTNPGTGFDLSATFAGVKPIATTGTELDVGGTVAQASLDLKPGMGFDLSSTFQGSNPSGGRREVTTTGGNHVDPKPASAHSTGNNSHAGLDLSQTFAGASAGSPAADSDSASEGTPSTESISTTAKIVGSRGLGFDLSVTLTGAAAPETSTKALESTLDRRGSSRRRRHLSTDEQLEVLRQLAELRQQLSAAGPAVRHRRSAPTPQREMSEMLAQDTYNTIKALNNLQASLGSQDRCRVTLLNCTELPPMGVCRGISAGRCRVMQKNASLSLLTIIIMPLTFFGTCLFVRFAFFGNDNKVDTDKEKGKAAGK